MPKSLKSRLIILVILVAGLPILLSDYYLVKTATQTMVVEKQRKLFGAGKMLDAYLVGTYEDILQKDGAQDASNETKIQVLNKELRQYTDQIAQAYPGIGVGYYSRDLDSIITYGPSTMYADKVGVPISSNHEGRVVMETGVPRVQVGDLVRGQIMNTMQPIIRNGDIIGYIWANELTVDIESQLKDMKRHFLWVILGGLFIGITGIVFVLNHLMTGINHIKKGLRNIQDDLSYEIVPTSDEMGEIALAINAMARDLAAKKILEEQVQRVDRLAVIGEMAAGLAHEIRNPLMAIKGFAELQDEDITIQERHEYTGIIIAEVERMNHLIEQLLGFSRPTLDLLKQVNVNEVLKNTLILAEIRVSGMDVVFEANLADHLPDITVNEEKLKQVSLNIMINAIQAMNKKGKIRISSYYVKSLDEVHVSFTDTGPGIESEILCKIFDPFFTTKENGTGLGLSVANYLMLSWNGAILVESIMDQGSIFTLTFPAARSEANDGNTSS